MDAALYESRHSFVWNFGADLRPAARSATGRTHSGSRLRHWSTDRQNCRIRRARRGIDRSPDMIGQARQNYPNLEFKLADAASFSFPGEFDAVFSNAALHWIRKPESVIQSIASSSSARRSLCGRVRREAKRWPLRRSR